MNKVIDDGGLKRELFYLLNEFIFDSKNNFFKLNTESYYFYFYNTCHQKKNPLFDDFSIETQFKLIGMLFGMAIYNNVILNLHFPSCFYRLLLGKSLRVDDLLQFSPSLAHGLQQLLEIRDESQFEVLDLFFDIMLDNQSVPLCENGHHIPVTIHNVSLYVQLYIQYVLYDSCKLQFDALKYGFWLTCSGKAMSLLHPKDLELFLCGSSKLDFIALEKQTKYLNGYNRKSSVIIWFWDILQNFNYDQKQKFLLFVTGTPRAPTFGLSQLQFTIQRSGDHSDRLPVAHTCYNILDLPVCIFFLTLPLVLFIFIHYFSF